MVALPFIPGTCKITIKQAFASVNVYNVLHAFMNNTASPTQGEMDALSAAVRSAWVTNVLPLQSNQVTLSDVQVIDLTNDVGGGSVTTGSNTGGRASAAQPANSAVCWSWKIANRYRGGHPRTYIAGLTADQVLNANTVTSAQVTAHAAAAAAIRTAVNAVAANGGTATLGAVSYYKDKAIRATPAFYSFTGVSVDNRIDSQRRRLGRDR